MSISAKDPIYHPGGTPDSVYLFCTWTQFDSGDVSQGGYSNGDIYVAVSNNAGQTWSRRYNLTNTKTPNCAPGECLSEHWSSLAENMYDGDLHIEYVCDRDAGGAITPEGAWTDNSMMYMHVQQILPPPMPHVDTVGRTEVFANSFGFINWGDKVLNASHERHGDTIYYTFTVESNGDTSVFTGPGTFYLEQYPLQWVMRIGTELTNNQGINVSVNYSSRGSVIDPCHLYGDVIVDVIRAEIDSTLIYCCSLQVVLDTCGPTVSSHTTGTVNDDGIRYLVEMLMEETMLGDTTLQSISLSAISPEHTKSGNARYKIVAADSQAVITFDQWDIHRDGVLLELSQPSTMSQWWTSEDFWWDSHLDFTNGEETVHLITQSDAQFSPVWKTPAWNWKDFGKATVKCAVVGGIAGGIGGGAAGILPGAGAGALCCAADYCMDRLFEKLGWKGDSISVETEAFFETFEGNLHYNFAASGQVVPHCGISVSLLDPPSWTTPPIKVPPTGSRTIKLKVKGIYNLCGDYGVTTSDPRVTIDVNPTGYLCPGDSVTVEGTIHCTGESFINATITIHGCIGTEDDTTIQLPLFAVCSNDYYECDRDYKTWYVWDNCKLRLWACVNCAEKVWDKRVVLPEPEDTHQVIFSGGVIVATTLGTDTVVGRQDYRDVFTGARDTVNVVEGYDYSELVCNIKKLHFKKTYVWYYPDLIPSNPKNPRYPWITIHKQIILYRDRPGFTCPNWKKEQIIKYVWIEWGRPPGWWPNPGPYTGHEEIYFGVFADINAPFDEGCYGCNTAGYDYTRQIIWQHGWYNDTLPGGHPEYEDYYAGLAFTDKNGAVVAPFGMQDVRNDRFLSPQGGWGWKDGELYQLAATPGVNIQDPDSVKDRTVVLTSSNIPAGTDTTFQSEFILIEAFIPTGLADLQAHIDQTRAVLIPELNSLEIFEKDFPICGDLTDDGTVDASDLVYLLNYLFVHGPQPPWPMSRADVTNDGVVDASDLVYLLNYLFVHGPEPHCSGFGR
jgi:hypothetical protein